MKPMAPGSIFYHISFPSTFICIFTFRIYIIEIPKIFILSYYLHQISLSQVTVKGLCNTPDVTFHICNSNSCHFRLCDMLFPSWLGFVFCFAFCSCHASHLIASCALHLHVFIKLASARSCRSSLPSVAFVDPFETNRVFGSLLSNHLTSRRPPRLLVRNLPELDPGGRDQCVRIISKHP